MGSRMDRSLAPPRLTTGVVVSLLRVFGVRRRKWPWSVAEVTHGGAESWGLFLLRAGPERERSLLTRRMTAQALVTRSAAEPSEVRVWPRSDGIVLAGRLRTRIWTVFGIVPGHRHDERSSIWPVS